MSSLQTEEYIKKIKEKIKNLDVEKEQREKNILSSPSEKEKKMNMLNDKFKNNDITSDSLKTN